MVNTLPGPSNNAWPLGRHIMRRYFQAHRTETVQILHTIQAEERGVAGMAVSRKEK
jgi:hypothetical protein